MIKTNCIHFPLDRPCRFHKKSGVKCVSCGKYVPINSHTDTMHGKKAAGISGRDNFSVPYARLFNTLSAVRKDTTAAGKNKKKKILIIKIGAMGDVLRTTFLLAGLKEKYPGFSVTWVVAPESAPMLQKNPNVSRVWNNGPSVFNRIARERFDICISLDLAPESLIFATLAKAPKKIGYWLDSRRKIICSGNFAVKWLNMSAFDDLKKSNRKTYQYWMSKIAGLPKSDYGIYTPLTAASLKKAAAFGNRHGLDGRIVVGINPGAGKRWRFKKWTDPGYIRLIKELDSNGVKVVLLGGRGEEALLSKLVKQTGGLAASSGTNNSLLDFFALVNLCDVVVTGDTMALHAALGLKKKVVAIFGPTSSAEIEMYSRGDKVTTPAKCACCYLPDCDVRPDCMSRIAPEKVINAVMAQVNSLENDLKDK